MKEEKEEEEEEEEEKKKEEEKEEKQYHPHRQSKHKLKAMVTLPVASPLKLSPSSPTRPTRSHQFINCAELHFSIFITIFKKSL